MATSNYAKLEWIVSMGKKIVSGEYISSDCSPNMNLTSNQKRSSKVSGNFSAFILGNRFAFNSFAMCIAPLPVATEEVHVMLIKQKGTLNTGNVVTEKTKEVLERI